MNHHPIFESFARVTSIGTGNLVFDFLGSATDVSFRKGWSQHAIRDGQQVTPAYPVLNEHYFDWVATLNAVDRARGVFRMAELGAGWAPWLIRAALAARQRPAIARLELVAVEADEMHFDWVRRHFTTNGVGGDGVHCLRGAVTGRSGVARFPKVTNPDENYGASTRQAMGAHDVIEIPAFTIAEVLGRFSGTVDLVHMDIQGSEYEALPPAMALLRHQVKSVMVGTHVSLDLHRQLAAQFHEEGWREAINFERNALCETPFGPVQFGDGFLLFENPDLTAASSAGQKPAP